MMRARLFCAVRGVKGSLLHNSFSKSRELKGQAYAWR